MPSPFPGMDPYLEGSQWMSIHSALSIEIARQLAPRLPVPESIPHLTVEIRDVTGRELVTAIEVLSPTNKRGEGRQEYLAKRRRILLSNAHLVEIDLLRSGRRVPMREPLPRYPYFAFVGRAEKRPRTEVWPIRLDQPLPTIPIPLLPGDADVSLDLQASLSSVYETFHYERTIDYNRPPEVPLRPAATAAWAEQLLNARRVGRPH
jgi:hypothetical protein